ncbi:MAG: NAD(P)/FAD-dependent oxidoreductase [Oscillospiraceae bacterium]
MESIWEKTCRGPARPPLYGKAQADVAVIGGGMTGILTALELQERGLQVVVAEAGHVGGGQTGRTTAKLTAQHGAIYAGLIERLGREKAAMYARANRRAVERCCARIELEQIDCDLERTDSWLYSYDREDSCCARQRRSGRSGWTRRSSRTPLCRCVYAAACGCAGRRSSIR